MNLASFGGHIFMVLMDLGWWVVDLGRVDD
jgi:hypothetical protein